TQVVLPLLESDLFAVMRAVTAGTLAETPVRFSTRHAACVVLASGGYPAKYQTGFPISGLTDGQAPGATVYHAGTKREGDTLLTAGGRVLGVTATGDTLRLAVDAAYRAADGISFAGMHRRNDIGARALHAKQG
ncbi:MAG TPA: phosphoribosylglycinamide synthetase C domain-containing protein, partial [Oscillospiraceae bacterium]|nr:phosphoribosylglycinamide synthetase C domain-containing protein [Oscillospiraceae bacterium]